MVSIQAAKTPHSVNLLCLEIISPSFIRFHRSLFPFQRRMATHLSRTRDMPRDCQMTVKTAYKAQRMRSPSDFSRSAGIQQLPLANFCQTRRFLIDGEIRGYNHIIVCKDMKFDLFSKIRIMLFLVSTIQCSTSQKLINKLLVIIFIFNQVLEEERERE